MNEKKSMLHANDSDIARLDFCVSDINTTTHVDARDLTCGAAGDSTANLTFGTFIHSKRMKLDPHASLRSG